MWPSPKTPRTRRSERIFDNRAPHSVTLSTRSSGWLAALALVAVFTAACPGRPLRAQQPPQPELWLAPLQPYVRVDGSKAGAVDYFDLFRPNAPWADTARHVSVFKIYPELLRSASDDELRRMVGDLRERRIRLGLETKILTQTGSCRPGDDHSSWMVTLVQRLHRLGADLDSVSMVGPLVDGHVSAGAAYCHRPIPEVAADAAHTVAQMRAIYPNLSVGEIEPVGGGPGFPTAAELGQWFAAFHEASGLPVAFLHVDTVWGTAWQQDMRAVARQAAASGVRFGVIYKADPTEISDAAFARVALANADAAEAVLGGPPNQVIIQSWEDYPRHAMPDSDMSTLTGIARAYLRPHTTMALAKPGRLRIASSDGVPIAEARFLVQRLASEPHDALVPHQIEGTVPHKAVSALFALRVHAECTCTADPVSLTVGGFDFRQAGRADFTWTMAGWGRPIASVNGTPAARIDAAAGQKFILNGPPFPVVADQPFAARFDWQVPAAGQDAGFVAIVFQGADGAEVRRAAERLQPSWQTISTLATGPDGIAGLPPIERQPGTSIRLEYPGDLFHRPATLPLGPS